MQSVDKIHETQESAAADRQVEHLTDSQLLQEVTTQRQTLELLADGVLVTAADGQLVNFNRLYIQMWAVPEDVIARGHARALLEHLQTLFTDGAAAHAQFAATLASTAAETFDVLMLADGRVFEQVTKLSVINGHAAGRVWSVRDISHRKPPSSSANDSREVETAESLSDTTEQRALQLQLTQLQQMNPMRRLSGGVVHDFNNLLTVVLGNLDTLSRRLPAADERSKRAAQQATRGAQRAVALAKQMLAFSRRQSLLPKPTDINRLVSAVFGLLHRTIGENIYIETLLGEGVWPVEIDPVQLESALLNLAVNARDAMPSGGRITVETTNTHFDEEYAERLFNITPGQYVLISISDTGQAINASVIANAIDPVLTTQGAGEGPGFGLSHVYEYVKRSGGHVKIDSREGRGTTFKIYLPRLKDRMLERTSERAPHEYPGRADETILVVEDDSDVRSFSLDTLSDLGYSVLEARDAQVALRILQDHPEIKLVFSDVGLPGMNGRELMAAIREVKPSIKALFTSGYTRHAIVQDGRLDAGAELLTKPFTRVQLADHVRRILDEAPAPAAGTQGIALIVEDDSAIRMFIADALNDFGFAVIDAPTLAGAFAAIDDQPRIDLAIVDVGLPDGTGTDIAAELLHQLPFIKVVMVSGDPSTFTGPLTRERQVAFVAKPFDQEDLRFALDRLAVKYRT